MGDAATSPRRRYREQVRDEIKARAWTQVAATGAAALSLNAIARQMGISDPALYRYFRNRDELVTELVLDAYRDLSATCRAAVTPGDPPAARVAAMAAAMREWALAALHRYVLTYGTPVPGRRQWAASHPAPPDTMRRALTFWTRLHGVISLEVAGHFADMKFDPALLYAAETATAINTPITG
jgi:AcrR family transcriptional regulator